MAGSNSTRRGMVRVVSQQAGAVPVIAASAIPRVQFSSGSARALENFARDMFSLSNGFQDQLDEQAQAESTVQGAIDGAAGVPQLQDYGTIRGRAYNKAAVETFVTTMETNSIFKVAQLQQEFGSDPVKLQAALEAYGTGVSAEVSKLYAPAGPAFQQRLAVRALPAIEQAKDLRYKLTRDQADAAQLENEVALKAEISTLAADLFSENPARSQAAAEAVGALQNEYLQIFEAVDPVTNRPLYSAEERAKAKVDFYEDVMENAALSWFDQQDDKAGAYTKFTEEGFTIELKTSGAPAGKVIEAQDVPGKTRRKPIAPAVRDQLAAAAAATDPRVTVKVVSGGQAGIGEGGPRTGSTRHDHGGSADVVLMVDGRDVLPGEDKALYAKFFENAAAAGATGLGHYSWGIHVGGGSKAAWGPNTKGNTLDPEFGAAIERGRRGPPLDTKPRKVPIDIRKALPGGSMQKIEAEMRARIGFRNQLADREIQQQEKLLKAEQEMTTFELTNRLYSTGAVDPDTGVAVPPLSREDVTTAVRRGSITGDQGNAIVKALATEKPAKSDEATLRDANARLYAGENIYTFILEHADKLSPEDSAELLGKNQTLNVAGEGGLSKEEQFHFDNLKSRLTPDSMMAAYDEGKQSRRYQALDEFRRRVGQGEDPREVADDVSERATLDFGVIDNTKLGGMVRPRFSVKQPNVNRIDLQASGRALVEAAKAGRITPAEFDRQKALLKQWADLQASLDATQAKGK
jgi:hypothetical protein